MSDAIVPVADASIAETAEYQHLVDKCRGICESARWSLIEHYWQLGEAISTLAPRELRARWGAGLMKRLQYDLGIDTTTLDRCVVLYETRTLSELGDARHLTWGKLRLLLPLPPEQRAEIEARILAGDLRTDEDVRNAIRELRRQLGLLPPADPFDVEPSLFGIDGLKKQHVEVLGRFWRDTPPPKRAEVLSELIPHLGLERLDRPEAIKTIRQLRRRLDSYERRLGAQ